MVAFIDILGFSNRVLSIKTKADVQSVYEDIKFIQSQFEHSPKDPLIKNSHEISNKEVLAFSDCIVVSVPLASEDITVSGTFDPLMGELTFFAVAQGLCASNAIFLRGGIDIDFWYHEGDGLISSALARAYRLEGEIGVPVIAVTDETYRFFSGHPHRKHYTKETDPVNSVFKEFLDLGTNKRFWFLDYIPICLNNLDWQVSEEIRREYLSALEEEKTTIMRKGWQENATRWLKDHRNAITRAYNSISDEKIQAKYEWLVQYHNEVITNLLGESYLQYKIEL